MTQINKYRPRTPRQAAACCGPIDDLLDPAFFKGLSDPTRLRLLGCLSKCGRPCTVTELAQCCSVDFSVVSRHLAILQRSGVVGAAKQGRTVHYAVKYDQLSKRLRALAAAVEGCCPPSPRRAKTNGSCCAR